MRPTRVLARRLGLRAAVSALAVAAFGWASVASLAAAWATPDVPSVTLAAIATSWALAVTVMAAESVGSSVLLLSEAGYRSPVTPLRPWSEVLRVSTGLVDNQRVPVVARRADDGDFPIAEDVLSGFGEQDADRAVGALTAWAPGAVGGDFAGISLERAQRAAFEAEAARVVAEVRRLTGREPKHQGWAEFGFPGLASAVVVDYGDNEAGEGVHVVARHGADLALVVDGRRHLRVTKRRSPDAATQVATLFGEHTTTRLPSTGAGFDQVRVDVPGGRPILFNAEEPDRYR